MKRIVIIDDDVELLEVLTSILSGEQNYEVVTYNDAFIARDYINNNTASINLIITDINMPGLSGLQLINECTDLTNMPVLFLTAMDQSDIIEEAYELSNKVLTINYLVKPFNLIIFLSSVKTMIRMQDYSNNLLYQNRKIAAIIEDLEEDNGDLARELINTLKDHDEDHAKLKKARELMRSVFNNDLPLMKFVLEVVTRNKGLLESIIGEGEDLFKVLPKTIEPLSTAIVDIAMIGQLLVDIGVFSKSDLYLANIENTTFYNIVFQIYKTGGFDTATFEKFIEMGKFEIKDDNVTFF